MTTYNTGNDVPSADARDRFDNSQTFDQVINGTLTYYPNRVGANVLSLKGMESLFQVDQGQRTADFNAAQAQRANDFAIAQEYREAQFNTFLESSGYETPVPYTTGLLIERYTQLIEKDGEFYRAEPGAIPFTTTGPWATDAAKLVSVGDAALRQELGSVTGAELVKLDGRSVADTIRGTINVYDGRFGAIGDGTYHPLSERYASLALAQVKYPFVTSLAQSIDWAAVQKACNVANGLAVNISGALVVTDTIDTATALLIRGGGVADWTPGYNLLIADGGTQLLFYGTGEKKWTVDHISDRSTAGGVIANPSAADPYTANAPAPFYKLLNFTNGDAVGVTRATLKPFSVGIYRRKGCRLENLRAVPYFNGVAGYQDSETGGLGADWDVGVWDESARSTMDDNIQVVGYWRKAAFLKTCSQKDPSIAPTGETSSHRRSVFQGYRGVAVRANDSYRVTAKTSSSIEIPWSASHRFPLTGTVRVTGVEYTYTGLSVATDKLTFTGVTPDTAAISVGVDLRVGGSNFGVSGSQLEDCYITALDHSSRMLATCNGLSSPFSSPAAAIEICGNPLRAIQLTNGTVITRDDILVFAPDCEDLTYSGTYFESQSGRSSLSVGVFTGDIPAGSRLIYERASTSVRAPYPAGGTRRLIVGGTCTFGPGVDRRPDVSATVSRYVTGTGLATARDFVDFPSAFPTTSDGDITMGAPNRHVRIRPGANGFVYVGPTDGGDANVQSTLNSLNLRSGLRVRFGSPTVDWASCDSAKLGPVTTDAMTSGAATIRWSAVYSAVYMFNATVGIFSGTGSPEGVVTAGRGSTYQRTDGSAGTISYDKASGSGNTGWVANA